MNISEEVKKLVSNSRKLKLKVLYENTDITKYIDQELISFSYSDSLNEFDSLDLTIQNRELLWMNDWNPLKGDKLECWLYLYNWETNSEVEIYIGTFYIDRVSYSGPPDIVTISALSVDIVSNIMDDKKNRVWEAVTFEKIAKDIAKECSLELVYECDFNREYKRIEQKLESYFNFLKRLGNEIGVIIKLYNDRLIIFEEKLYEEKDYKFIFHRNNIKSYSLETDDTDTYAGCKITYYDSYLGEKIEESFFTKQRAGYKRNTQRVLFINQEKEPPGDTKAQKRGYLSKIAEKALREKNKQSIRGTIEIIGKEELICVGDTIFLENFGIFTGKYLITSINTDLKIYDLTLEIRMVLDE